LLSSFDPTYKELKLTSDDNYLYVGGTGFDPTYKELKYVQPSGGIHFSIGFDPTYKELKYSAFFHF